MSVDILAEAKMGISPYAYGLGNPVRYSDPTGMIEEDDKGLMQVSTDLWGGGRNESFMNQSSSDASTRAGISQMQQAGFSTAGSGSGTGTGGGVNSWLSDGQQKRDMTTFSVEFNKYAGNEVGREIVDNGADISYEGAFRLRKTSWVERSGSYAAVASSMFTTLGELQHGGKFGLGTWRGKNGKFYAQGAASGKARPFYGNQHTGSVNRAASIARPLKLGGTAFGVYNYGSIEASYSNGNLTRRQRNAEFVSNTVGTFSGIWGVAWTIGWESGRAISTTNGYKDFKDKYGR